METLAQIYERHCVKGPDVGHGDKGGTHSYIDQYEVLLAPHREECCFMEIGLALGLSLAMWREYFGKWSTLFGVDLSIVFDKAPFTDDEGKADVRLIEADATKPGLLEKLPHVPFDVVIDDGSHMMADQVATFNLLKPRMASGGLYIIEDILALEAAKMVFKNLHANCEIIDLRHVKGRFDDVLVVYRF